MSFSLKKFDLDKISPHSVVLFLGKRNSGKTCGVLDLLHSKRNVNKIGIVMSKTDKFNKDFENIMPPKTVFHSYRQDKVKSLIARQTHVITNKLSPRDAFLVMDDVLSDGNIWKKDPQVEELFYNGRHYKLLFVLTSQCILGVPPNFRSNVDYVFLFRFIDKTEKDKIYNHYAGIFPTREEFEKVFNICTENYGCMVIDRTSKSNKLSNVVYYYKAELRSNFKMCYPGKLWKTKIEEPTQFNNDSVVKFRTTGKNGKYWLEV